jgi:hypothetical protein
VRGGVFAISIVSSKFPKFPKFPKLKHDYVRQKPDGAIAQVRGGKAYDVNGNKVPLKSPESHGITTETFKFRRE